MNYVIKYAFTKENPVPFKTQVEIINSHLVPLIEDEFFQEKKISFYITKIGLVNVRLAIYIDEKNQKEMQNIVLKYTNSLKLNTNDEWNKESGETEFLSKTPPTCQETFYRYLEDITMIGIDLHKKDLCSAVSYAAKVALEIKPIGSLIPREILDVYFKENSGWYKNKKDNELDIFWGDCGFGYLQGTTEGGHFYYNIVMGLDPRPSSLNVLLNLIGSIKGGVKIPAKGDQKCSEIIAFVINNILKIN